MNVLLETQFKLLLLMLMLLSSLVFSSSLELLQTRAFTNHICHLQQDHTGARQVVPLSCMPLAPECASDTWPTPSAPMHIPLLHGLVHVFRASSGTD